MEDPLYELHSDMLGGNVYTYWGRIDENHWFSYNLDVVGIYDADINEAMENEFYGKGDDNWDFGDWEMVHMITEYDPQDERTAWLTRKISVAFNIII